MGPRDSARTGQPEFQLASRAARNRSKKMILITGASGSVGKAVLQEAIRNESKVRGMYRSKEDAAKAPSGCEAVLADYADKQSLRKALDGVNSDRKSTRLNSSHT